MNHEALNDELIVLMNSVVNELQVIGNDGIIVKSNDEDTLILKGSDIALEITKKSLRIAEILKQFEHNEPF